MPVDLILVDVEAFLTILFFMEEYHWSINWPVDYINQLVHDNLYAPIFVDHIYDVVQVSSHDQVNLPSPTTNCHHFYGGYG